MRKVDRTVLRENLKLTCEQRLIKHQRALEKLQRAAGREKHKDLAP
jgi:hypothetical protein